MLVTFCLEIGEWFLLNPCISGQVEGHSHLQGTGLSAFTEHFAVLHDLAIKECLWERKNLFHNAAQTFVFSLVRVTALWFLPVGTRQEGGEMIMKIPRAGDCSFFSPVAGRIPSGSQGAQYSI